MERMRPIPYILCISFTIFLKLFLYNIREIIKGASSLLNRFVFGFSFFIHILLWLISEKIITCFREFSQIKHLNTIEKQTSATSIRSSFQVINLRGRCIDPTKTGKKLPPVRVHCFRISEVWFPVKIDRFGVERGALRWQQTR